MEIDFLLFLAATFLLLTALLDRVQSFGKETIGIKSKPKDLYPKTPFTQSVQQKKEESTNEKKKLNIPDFSDY